jgi:hypothetical protein
MSETLHQEAAVARTADDTEQANTLRPEPRYLLRGKLFFKRTWDYNTGANTEKVKEYLPGAKVELHVTKKGGAARAKWAEGELGEDGYFAFDDVPACSELALRIVLEHKKGITRIKGAENLVKKADYELQRGKVVWRTQALDKKKVDDATSAIVDFGDVEILPTSETDANFVELCELYKTIWRGYHWILDKTGHTLASCPVNYPSRTTSYHQNNELYILPGDLKDCDVNLHEYGHFVGSQVLGGLSHPGYNYNDDTKNSHSPISEEHYESAWNEGHANFLSCAMSDDAVYHDDYDANLTMNLATDNTTTGPHCEGSIQCALWDVYKVQGTDFKDGFWKAFAYKTRKADTIFAFYENWKDAGCAGLAKLKASLTKFNCHIGYRYTLSLPYTGKAYHAASPAAGFATVAELFEAYGKTSGGTLAAYEAEFYNRNRYVGGGAFAAGSHKGSFTLVLSNTYIVPERFEIT